MKTLYSKFDKKLISALPRALFEGVFCDSDRRRKRLGL